MPAPTPATDAELADLVMEVLKDPTAYRRLIGRLRPKLVGRPHPRRRLPRLREVVRCAKSLPAWAA